jgi:hypothetical protein
MEALATVRVAIFDLSYTPQPGETFQVNNTGQLVRLVTGPGELYQVDWFGFLQPVLLPAPTQLQTVITALNPEANSNINN